MRPNYRITADDNDITAELAEFRTRLEITDEAGMKSDRLSLEIADPEQKLKLPKAGAVLRISLGYDERYLANMGAWTVDQITVSGPPDVIRVTARAADMSTDIRSPRTRSWDNISLGDMVRTIAGEHRLGAKIAEAFIAELIEHVDQTQESDLNLLTRLASERDAIAKPANQLLLFVERAAGVSAGGTPLDTLTLTPSSITRWRVSLPQRTAAQAVTANYLDVLSDVPQKSLTVGQGSPAIELKETYPNANLARQAAQAAYTGARQKGGALSITMPGDPLIRAESPIMLSGFRPGLPVNWIAERVIHRIDDNGYSVDIIGVLPGSEEADDAGDD